MNRSESVKEIATALAKAQASLKGATKDSTNPHFKSKYADLASVWDACREALSANGIAVVQAPRSGEASVEVETMLLHSSGEFLSETLSIPVMKADAQGFGSALTYARRYGLASMVGVAPEDDDGNAAAKAQPANGTFKPATANPVTPTAGAFEQLDLERQKVVFYHASQITDNVTTGEVSLAYAMYLDAKEALTTEEQVALMSQMPSNVKTALKKHKAVTEERSLRDMGRQPGSQI